MVFKVTAPHAHVERGVVRTPRTSLTIYVEYPEISNIGNAAGLLGLKVNLVETKLGSDDTWLRYTSRADDSDSIEDMGEKPGIIRDKIARDTSFQFRTTAVHFPMEILPGATVTHSPILVLDLPGSNLGPSIKSFWDREGAVDFKLIVWLFEITAGSLTIPHNGPNGSVDRHEFPRAFRLEP